MTPLVELIRRYLAAEPYRRLTDDDLWARFAGPPDDQALCALLERCGGRIFARCRAVVGDEHLAEEAFQDTFVELYRRRARIPTYRAAVAWLYQTATNRSRKARRWHWRAVRRDQAKATATRELVAARVEVTAIEREDLSAVLGALAELPVRQRRALELVYQEGLTHEEAAATLGWTRGAVGVYVTRGLDRLRAVLRRRGVLTAGGGAVAVEAALSARLPALTAERAATLAGGVLARLEGRTLAQIGPWAVPWRVVAAVGLAAGLAVAGAAWWPRDPHPLPEQPPPVAMAPEPDPPETLQAKNLRILQTEVVPKLVAILRKHVRDGIEVRVVRTAATGSEVVAEFQPSRPDAGLFPKHIRIGYCVFRRELQWEHQPRPGGLWHKMDETGGIDVDLPLNFGPVPHLRFSAYHADLAAIRRALEALPRDDRAAAELVRWHFGPSGWAGTDLVIPAAGCWGVAGTRDRLYVRADDKVFFRTENSGWRYWGRGEGSLLAANDTHLFNLRGTEVWSHLITTPLAASVKLCPTPKSHLTPKREEVAYVTANNDFLIVKTKAEQRLWGRSLKDPTKDWVYFGTIYGWGVAVSPDRLFTVHCLKDHDRMMVQELSQPEGTWRPTGYSIPQHPADHLTVWGDRLIYPNQVNVLARPISGGPDAPWVVIGRHQDPDRR